MDSKDRSRYEAQSQIIKALAHPSRLMMVDKLNERQRSVAELTEMVGADTSTVSKHLSVLKHAGLVFTEKRGTTVFYHLRMPCLIDFFRCVEMVMESNARGQMETVLHCRRKESAEPIQG